MRKFNYERWKYYIATSLLLIGFILIYFNSIESKIGMKNENYIIQQTCESVYNLGDKTGNLLIKNKEIDSLYKLKELENIGDERYKLITKYFKEGENMLRPEMYILSLLFMVITVNIGSFIIVSNCIKSVIDNYILKEKLKQAISKIKE